MSVFFGDGFDLYAAVTDPYQGGTYWDSGVAAGVSLVPGRFSGSRAISFGNTVNALQKSSGVNESVHHINVSVYQVASLSGTNSCFTVQLKDGATPQCTVIFRADGAIILTSGDYFSAAIATYTGAVGALTTWFGFEIEVVIHNTAGSIAIRKNGNTVNDFSLGSLNTRGGTANNYANRLTIGQVNSFSGQYIDDFLWRSDASSVAWVGDIRCYTRMPVSDASVQWTPSAAVLPVANHFGPRNSSVTMSSTPKFLPFTAPCDGTVGSLSLINETAGTANIKCSIYVGSTGVPTTVLGSANLVTNPGVGTTTFTFSTPVAVSRGVQYYAAFCMDAGTCAFSYYSGTPPGGYSPLIAAAGNYATFPVTNPTSLSASTNWLATINITPTGAVNAPLVADTMQDAAASYVASSTVGQTDLYGIAPITVTPASVVGVTTRALCQKSDAGTRNIGVQLKSGATTSNGTSTALNTSWGWIYRSDLTDPATGAAWSAVAVNNLQIGETVTA
jgi:hypothetical protein